MLNENAYPLSLSPQQSNINYEHTNKLTIELKNDKKIKTKSP